jgi:hypothetical protein
MINPLISNPSAIGRVRIVQDIAVAELVVVM